MSQMAYFVVVTNRSVVVVMNLLVQTHKHIHLQPTLQTAYRLQYAMSRSP